MSDYAKKSYSINKNKWLIATWSSVVLMKAFLTEDVNPVRHQFDNVFFSTKFHTSWVNISVEDAGSMLTGQILISTVSYTSVETFKNSSEIFSRIPVKTAIIIHFEQRIWTPDNSCLYCIFSRTEELKFSLCCISQTVNQFYTSRIFARTGAREYRNSACFLTHLKERSTIVYLTLVRELIFSRVCQKGLRLRNFADAKYSRCTVVDLVNITTVFTMYISILILFCSKIKYATLTSPSEPSSLTGGIQNYLESGIVKTDGKVFENLPDCYKRPSSL